jgi:hypothetical protein
MPNHNFNVSPRSKESFMTHKLRNSVAVIKPNDYQVILCI